MNKKSLYQIEWERAQASGQVWSQHHGWRAWFYYGFYNAQKQGLEYNCCPAERFWEWCAANNIEVPSDLNPTVEEHARAVAKLLQDREILAQGSIHLVGRDNQDVLTSASFCLGSTFDSETNRHNGKRLAKETAALVRSTMTWFYHQQHEGLITWSLGESLETATVRAACYYDQFNYSNKFSDLKYCILRNKWIQISEAGERVSDFQVGAFAYDPIAPEVIAEFPDFSYDKLYHLAVENQRAWEKTHGREPVERFRFHEAFGKDLIGVGRTLPI